MRRLAVLAASAAIEAACALALTGCSEAGLGASQKDDAIDMFVDAAYEEQSAQISDIELDGGYSFDVTIASSYEGSSSSIDAAIDGDVEFIFAAPDDLSDISGYEASTSTSITVGASCGSGLFGGASYEESFGSNAYLKDGYLYIDYTDSQTNETSRDKISLEDIGIDADALSSYLQAGTRAIDTKTVAEFIPFDKDEAAETLDSLVTTGFVSGDEATLVFDAKETLAWAMSSFDDVLGVDMWSLEDILESIEDLDVDGDILVTATIGESGFESYCVYGSITVGLGSSESSSDLLYLFTNGAAVSVDFSVSFPTYKLNQGAVVKFPDLSDYC